MQLKYSKINAKASIRSNSYIHTLRYIGGIGLLFLSLFAYQQAWAANDAVQVQLVASSNEVAVGEDFTVQAIVRAGSKNAQINIAAMPIKGLEHFQQLGVSQETNFQFINGVSLVEYVHAYHLRAVKEGQYVIGPFEIPLPGAAGTQTQKSNTVTITVKNRSNTPFVTQAQQNTLKTAPTPKAGERTFGTDFPRTVQPSQMYFILKVVFFVLVFLLMYLWWNEQQSQAEKKSTSDKKRRKKTEVYTDNYKNAPQQRTKDNNTEANTAQSTLSSKDIITDLERIKDKTFYNEVTKFIHTCIAQFHQNTSEESTTDQSDTKDTLEEKLQTADITKHERELIRSILEDCRTAKYAPDTDQKRKEIMEKLHTLLQSTG